MSESSDTPTTQSTSYPIVYVGPSSANLGLIRFHQYTELDLNSQVQQAITDNPALNLLLIPLDEFVGMAPAIYAGTNASINHAVDLLTSQGVL